MWLLMGLAAAPNFRAPPTSVFTREMQLVQPLAAIGVLAAVLAPVDGEPLAQHAGRHPGLDVEPHAVVQVGLPAQWLIAGVASSARRRRWASGMAGKGASRATASAIRLACAAVSAVSRAATVRSRWERRSEGRGGMECLGS